MITLSPGNPMRVVLMTVLIFEVIVYGLAVPVMIFISDVPGAAAGGFGGGTAVLALVAAGMLRSQVGYVLGWLTQFAGLALGLLTPTMFIVGAGCAIDGGTSTLSIAWMMPLLAVTSAVVTAEWLT